MSDLELNGNYADATQSCDVVMEGGITSGIVYPLAICKLAKTYRFKNIGGTSAGAIAAAAAAAAELGRETGAGFKELEKLPKWLGDDVNYDRGKRSNLFALFQPSKSAGGLFDTLTEFLGSTAGRPKRVLMAALRCFWLQALMGVVTGLALVLPLVLRIDGPWRRWGVGLCLLAITLGIVIAVTWADTA